MCHVKCVWTLAQANIMESMCATGVLDSLSDPYAEFKIEVMFARLNPKASVSLIKHTGINVARVGSRNALTSA